MTAPETSVLKVWSLDEPLRHQLRKANSQASPQTPESNSGGGKPTPCGDEVSRDSDLTAEAPESEKVNPRNQTDQKDAPSKKHGHPHPAPRGHPRRRRYLLVHFVFVHVMDGMIQFLYVKLKGKNTDIQNRTSRERIRR